MGWVVGPWVLLPLVQWLRVACIVGLWVLGGSVGRRGGVVAGCRPRCLFLLLLLLGDPRPLRAPPWPPPLFLERVWACRALLGVVSGPPKVLCIHGGGKNEERMRVVHGMEGWPPWWCVCACGRPIIYLISVCAEVRGRRRALTRCDSMRSSSFVLVDLTVARAMLGCVLTRSTHSKTRRTAMMVRRQWRQARGMPVAAGGGIVDVGEMCIWRRWIRRRFINHVDSRNNKGAWGEEDQPMQGFVGGGG